MLKGKHAVVFGAAGSIGTVVATQFAAEGGLAHVAIVDAEDPTAVDGYVDGVAREAGSIDVVFNLIGPRAKDYGNGKPAMRSSVDEFMVPLTMLMRSQFITSRAAARHMVEQRS